MYQDFLKIRDQEDPYRYKYMSDPPDTVAYADAQVAQRTLSMLRIGLSDGKVTLAASDFLLISRQLPTSFAWLNALVNKDDRLHIR